MRNTVRLIAMLSLTGLAAWNSHAHAADPAPQSSVAPPTETSGTKAAPTNDARDKRLRAMGYRPEQRHGETIYCRHEAVVGSRFESKVCGTADDLDRATTDSQDAVNNIQRHQENPMGK